ncbi:MAG: glycosyltransferase [Novosphingobium sp.]|nr:glycosyltransferase [Novosphingobium sp.]
MADVTRPTISVVIPNYNRAGLIGETLANVLAQSLPPAEVIVVDDGSTDASAEVVAGFGDKVRLILQANRGPGAARNRGLAEATGELIQFMDSDDLWSLNKLEAQARALAETGADFAYSPWLQARVEGGRALYADPVLQQRPLPASRSPLAWFLRGWVTVFQCCLFRRELLDCVGPYREDLMPSEDSELLFRILKSGARPAHVPEALALYRLHGGYQISRGGMEKARRVEDWDKFTRLVAEQLDEVGGLTSADRRSWARTRRAAAGALASRPAPLGDRLGRIGERIARRLRGSSWPPPYQAGPLTPAQRELLAEIGYAAEPA